MREIACHDLCFSRPAPDGGTADILDRICCRFSGGSVSVISGPTGAGKSTFVQILGGLMRPTSGEVRADGAPVSRWVTAHKDLWRRDVGIVFQHCGLLDGLNVFENVLLPLIVRKKRIKDMRSEAAAALQRLEAGHLSARPAAELSGGERQKVAIARALCTAPGLLLADEPTAHQDDRSAARIMALLKAHARSGHIVIIVAHDQRVLAADFGDRHFRLADGSLEQAR